MTILYKIYKEGSYLESLDTNATKQGTYSANFTPIEDISGNNVYKTQHKNIAEGLALIIGGHAVQEDTNTELKKDNEK